MSTQFFDCVRCTLNEPKINCLRIDINTFSSTILLTYSLWLNKIHVNCTKSHVCIILNILREKMFSKHFLLNQIKIFLFLLKLLFRYIKS